jgi:hypothetical protein
MLAANCRLYPRAATLMVTVLLGAGADVRAVSSEGLNALHLAVWGGLQPVVEVLLDHAGRVSDFDIDAADTMRGYTALMAAARGRHASIAALLRAAGADWSPVNYDGYTALHVAVMHGGFIITNQFLAAGAPVDAGDAAGRTALMLAAGGQNQGDMVGLLLLRGASVAHRTLMSDLTALDFAAASSAHEATKRLLRHRDIHSAVPRAYDMIGVGAFIEGVAFTEKHAAATRKEFDGWKGAMEVINAVFAAGPGGYGDTGVERLSRMMTGLQRVQAAGVSPEDLSTLRNPEGFTALGAAAASGASEPTVAVLVKAGFSALVAGNREGASPGALASRRANNGRVSAQLYRAASKAAARSQPAFRRVRSELVLFNRVPGGVPQDYLPRDVVDHILEWCATPRAGGWFAKSAEPAAGAAPAAVSGAALGGGAAGAGAGAEGGAGGAAGGAGAMIPSRAAAKRARTSK